MIQQLDGVLDAAFVDATSTHFDFEVDLLDFDVDFEGGSGQGSAVAAGRSHALSV